MVGKTANFLTDTKSQARGGWVSFCAVEFSVQCAWESVAREVGQCPMGEKTFTQPKGHCSLLRPLARKMNAFEIESLFALSVGKKLLQIKCFSGICEDK